MSRMFRAPTVVPLLCVPSDSPLHDTPVECLLSSLLVVCRADGKASNGPSMPYEGAARCASACSEPSSCLKFIMPTTMAPSNKHQACHKAGTFDNSQQLQGMHLRAAAYLSLSFKPPFSASLRRTLSLSLFALARTCTVFRQVGLA